jgi:hypothetical protein
MATTPQVDKFIGKVVSRKLLVFLTGSVFFVAGLGLTAEDWMHLAMIYIGTQGLVDAVISARGGTVESK